MKAKVVTNTPEIALRASGYDHATAVHQPRLVSHDGASYTTGERAVWFDDRDMKQSPGNATFASSG